MAGVGMLCKAEMETNVDFEEDSVNKSFSSDAVPEHRILNKGVAWEAECPTCGLVIHNLGYKSAWKEGEEQNYAGAAEARCVTCQDSTALPLRNVMFYSCDWEIKFKKVNNNSPMVIRRGTTPSSGFLTWNPDDNDSNSLFLHQYKMFKIEQCVVHRPVSAGDHVFLQDDFVKGDNRRGTVELEGTDGGSMKILCDDGDSVWKNKDKVVKVF